MTWREFNRIHERYSKRAAKIFRIGLMRHFEKMLEAAKDNGFRDLSLVITRADSSDINKAFINVYQGTGIDAAFGTFDDMTKKSRQFIDTDNGKKNVRSKWLKELEGIALDETIPARGAVLTTSQEIFVDFVDDALSKGASLTDVAKGLRMKFNEIMPWRSFNIARTEVLSAYNFGSEIGAQETGFQFKRTWLASVDGRERASHRAVSGTPAINGGWIVEQPSGGMPDFMRFPGDPRASAANRVNCRCTVIREVI